MFDVREIAGEKYRAIVTAMDYQSSLDDLEAIEAELRNRFGNVGRIQVLIDLICPNGLSSNRFASAYFDGEKLDEDSLVTMSSDDVDPLLRRQQVEFFRMTGVLAGSVLSRSARQTLLA